MIAFFKYKLELWKMMVIHHSQAITGTTARNVTSLSHLNSQFLLIFQRTDFGPKLTQKAGYKEDF
jgi:hypothetical protein